MGDPTGKAAEAPIPPRGFAECPQRKSTGRIHKQKQQSMRKNLCENLYAEKKFYVQRNRRYTQRKISMGREIVTLRKEI
ncbi:hypothetical protein GCM10009865_38240 [Aeromicrobium ponti]